MVGKSWSTGEPTCRWELATDRVCDQQGMGAELGVGTLRTFQGYKKLSKAALWSVLSRAPLRPTAGKAGGKDTSFKPSSLLGALE